MFSGIVEAQGELQRIRKTAKGARLFIQHRGLGKGVRVGDSIAVDGCCLTVVSNRGGIFEFDVLHETLRCTTLSVSRPGTRVNLEKALKSGDPIGGHFVTGHIDGMGRISHHEPRGTDVWMKIEPPRGFLKWIILKGSVSVDGVSLTVGGVDRKGFGIWLIPHTLKLTTLGWKRQGDQVNLEADMLAKYAQKAVRP